MELNKVYLGDCINIMKTLCDKSTDLVFAAPPFNIGIKYDVHNDKCHTKSIISGQESG